MPPPEAVNLAALEPRTVLALQMSAGNTAVGRLLSDPPGWAEPAASVIDTPVSAAEPSLIALGSAFGTQAASALIPRRRSRTGFVPGAPPRDGPRPAAAISRTTAGDMAAAAEEEEFAAGGDQQAEPRFITTITNVGDVNQATRVRDEIIGYRSNMAQGMSDGEGFVTPDQNRANEEAIRVLDQYVGDARTQGSTLGDFQSQVQRLERDYVRLMSQIQTYAGSEQGQGTNDSSDPAAVGRAEIASTGRTTEQLQNDFRRATTGATGTGSTAEHQEAAQQWLDTMRRESQNVSRTQGVSVSKEQRAKAATENLHSVLLGQQGDALRGQIEGLKQKAADAKEMVGLIGGFVKSATAIATTAATGGAMAGPTSGGVASGAADIANFFAAHQYDDDIADIKRTLGPIQDEVARSKVLEAANSAAAAKGEYITACQDYVNATANLENAQTEYRRSMREMGASADVAAGTEGRFEVIAQLLSEADAYLAQADATLAIGDRELEQSRATTRSAGDLEKRQESGVTGTKWYRPYQRYHRGTLSYNAVLMIFTLYLGTSDTHTGSAEGEQYGVNPVMARAMEQLREQRSQVEQHANVLRQVFNTAARRSPVPTGAR